jgi:hypothetical protein
MNRSIFIVIVDFLLLSLLAFARFDSDQDVTTRKGGQLAQQLQPGQTQVGQKEMLNVLKLSLEEERQVRERLKGQLTETQDTLRTREELLAVREKSIQESQLSLQRKNEEAKKLAAERALLKEQMAQAQTALSALNNRLAVTTSEAKSSKERLTAMETDLRKRQEELNLANTEAKFSKERLAAMEADLRTRQDELIKASTVSAVSRERLAAMEAELRKREAEAERMRKSLSDVEQKRLAAESEKQKLASQLQLTEAEKRMTFEQLQSARGEVANVREEKAKLVEQTGKLAANVSALAEKSENLSTELQKNRPLAPNAIYNEFLTNRVQSFVQASRHGLFGQSIDRQKEGKTVLIRQGTNTYAILHVDDTPIAFGVPGTDWDRIYGHLRHGGDTAPVSQIVFWGTDPRVLILPVNEAYAARWGVKTYSIAEDPFKFQEAVLVGGTENYYGECKFQIDATNPRYVRMDRNIFKRLVGNFSPSGGDLVFTKTGQVIGVMVNKEFCAVLNNFGSFFNIRTGPDIAAQQTGTILAAMRHQLEALPLRLQ